MYDRDTPPAAGVNRNRTPRVQPIFLIAVVVLVALIAVFVALRVLSPAAATTGKNGQPTSVPSPGSTSSSGAPTNKGSSAGSVPVSAQQAVIFMDHYFADINARNYQGAYSLWGKQFRSTTSFDTFANGFTGTQKDDARYGTVTQMANGTTKVPITLTATMAQGALTVVNTYKGYYVVGLEEANARIVDANMQLQASSDDRVRQAADIVNQYYSNINAKNYQAAYNLWGSAYHRSTPYQQFVQGFANTQSDSVSIPFSNISVQKDGQVNVPVTVHAVDTAQNSTIAHTYQGYFIVGMEAQNWLLLTANIRQVS